MRDESPDVVFANFDFTRVVFTNDISLFKHWKFAAGETQLVESPNNHS